MKILLTLILLQISSLLSAKRAEMSVSDIKPMASHVFVGFIESLKGNAFRVLVLKQYSGTESLKGHISINQQNPMTKPSENPDVGKMYLIFANKMPNSSWGIIRRLEVGDFSVTKQELTDQKILTQCEIGTISCLLK